MLQRVHSSYILRIAAVISVVMLTFLTANAQQGKKKIVTIAPDTIPLFRGIAVSTDLVGPAQLAFGSYGQYQAAMRVNLKDKWFPIIELGIGKANAEDVTTKLTYKSTAPYGRIGMDWNLSKNKHDIYRVYGGFRYAYTSFKYDVSSPGIVDPVWGDKTDFNAKDVSCTYHWLEGVFTIDAKIFGPVRMGWSVRYKRRLFHTHGDIGEAWYVPGYGKSGNSRLGGEFNITFEL